jgi:hypothetical protein
MQVQTKLSELSASHTFNDAQPGQNDVTLNLEWDLMQEMLTAHHEDVEQIFPSFMGVDLATDEKNGVDE